MITYQSFHFDNYRNCFAVTDAHIARLFAIDGSNVFILPRGERAKTLANVQKLCGWLLLQGAQKDDTLVAVGGGSVGDVAGFCASVYKRGINLLQVPTTFLAQIDSGIGGKTAVDLNGVKNALGTFYCGDTLIDVEFLRTLPKKQWKNGQGELLKYRMLSAEVEKISAEGNLAQTVKVCAEYKRQICAQDPFDRKERRLLNFGHTIGHAMELSCGICHGEAVANGIFYETLLAFKLGSVTGSYLEKWQGEVKKLFDVRPLTRQILELTKQDKKNCGGVGFVLPCAGGFCQKQISFDELTELMI